MSPKDAEKLKMPQPQIMPGCLYVYIFLMYNIVNTICLTGMLVPYYSMISLVTANPYERGFLGNIQQIFQTLGNVVVNKEGKKVLVPGRTIICALGQRSRTDIVDELRDCASYVSVIGDASRVSTITNAVYWGYHAALDI